MSFMPASSAATAPVNCFEGTRSTFGGVFGWTFGCGALALTAALPLAFAGRTFAALCFFVLTNLEATLDFGLFLLVPFEGFGFFGIARVGQLITSPPRASQAARVF
jgi:hypothetical protein